MTLAPRSGGTGDHLENAHRAKVTEPVPAPGPLRQHTGLVRGLVRTLRETDQPFVRAFRSGDFRLLWAGAFLSFTGGMVQNVAQGYVVYEITGSNAKLAAVTVAFMIPMSVFSPVGGVVADLFDRRRVLVYAMLLSALGPAWLAFATFTGRLQYWHFLAVSLVGGLIQCVEVPTRQAVVREVVDPEDLPGAIPAQAMTFNFARVVGPTIGGLVYAAVGPWLCFLINSLSYGALAGSALRIRRDLSAPAREAQPLFDLITGGIRYVFQDKALRMLFLMEAATSVLGMFYVSQMPALARSVWGLDAKGLGVSMSFIGIGAVCGLVFNAAVAGMRWRTRQALFAMLLVSIGLALLGSLPGPSTGFFALMLIGAAIIVQFNSTNALFQMLSTAKLRGRVLSMHMWAISGLAPVGIFLFGWIAELVGLRLALQLGGMVLFVSWLVAFFNRKSLREP